MNNLVQAGKPATVQMEMAPGADSLVGAAMMDIPHQRQPYQDSNKGSLSSSVPSLKVSYSQCFTQGLLYKL